MTTLSTEELAACRPSAEDKYKQSWQSLPDEIKEPWECAWIAARAFIPPVKESKCCLQLNGGVISTTVSSGHTVSDRGVLSPPCQKKWSAGELNPATVA